MKSVKSRSLRTSSRSPWFFLSGISISIFVAEVFVMFVLALLPKLPDLVESLLDGTLLSLLVAPALYYFLYRPLTAENHDRQLIEQELRRSSEILQAQAEQLYEYSQTLEQQVNDRTAALSTKNQELETLLTKLHSTQAQMVQTEKMSSLGQLVAGIAHEINNPVSFIHGNIGHLRQYTDDLLDVITQAAAANPASIDTESIDLDFLRDDLPKLFHSMETGTDRIQQIVLSLRNFSRLDEVGIKAVDLHQGLDSSLMLLQQRLNDQGDHPTIQVIKDYGLTTPVECDAGAINQVFMNLLSNAIEAIEARSFEDFRDQAPTITISTALRENDHVAITIGDNGVGIADNIQTKLFDPFFTTKPVGQGTGLGLSTSYQIITEAHGGKLWFESAIGQGTKFVIELPMR
jgi:signal transduction histidine kinase